MAGWNLNNGNADVHQNSGALTYLLGRGGYVGYLCSGAPTSECGNPSQQTVTLELGEDSSNFHPFHTMCGEITQTFVCEPCNRDALTMWFNDGTSNGNQRYDNILYYNNWNDAKTYIDSKNVDECRIIVLDNSDTHDGIHVGGQRFDTSAYTDSTYPFIAKLNDKGEPISSGTVSGKTVYYPENKYKSQKYNGHKIKYHVKGNTIPNNFFSGNSTNQFNKDLVEVYFQGSIKEIEDGDINNGAFSKCYGLSALTLNNVEKIGTSAFNGCTALTYVDFGHWCSSGRTSTNLREIGAYAFKNCQSLKGITILPGLKTIDIAAFDSCDGLKDVVLPNTVRKLGNSAFRGCTSLSSITISSGITEVGNTVFEDTPWYQGISGSSISGHIVYVEDIAYICENESITSATFANNTKCIAGTAFMGCSNLTNIVIPNSVVSVGNSAFRDCTGITSCTIGNSVKTIGNYSFGDCSSLTSITIPSSVETIGSGAFSSCSNLTRITSLSMTAPTIENNTFANVGSNGTLYVPSGSSGYDVWIAQLNNWTIIEQ